MKSVGDLMQGGVEDGQAVWRQVCSRGYTPHAWGCYATFSSTPELGQGEAAVELYVAAARQDGIQ